MGDKTVDEPQSLVRRELEFSSVQLTCRETATEESSFVASAITVAVA